MKRDELDRRWQSNPGPIKFESEIRNVFISMKIHFAAGMLSHSR